MVRITQGVTERADQWLRSMDRLTFFNIDLDLTLTLALTLTLTLALTLTLTLTFTRKPLAGL